MKTHIKANEIKDFGYFFNEDDWVKMDTAIRALDELADLLVHADCNLYHLISLPVDTLREYAGNVRFVERADEGFKPTNP